MKSLVNMKFKDYNLKDPEMPDCSICLEEFRDEDDIVVFECDPKHYFHADCGLEWLKNKPECPLCRTDFTKKIMQHQKKFD